MPRRSPAFPPIYRDTTRAVASAWLRGDQATADAVVRALAPVEFAGLLLELHDFHMATADPSLAECASHVAAMAQPPQAERAADLGGRLIGSVIAAL